jgi:hypothetical protein
MKQLILISVATTISILLATAIVFAIFSYADFERKVDERALLIQDAFPGDYEKAKATARVLIQNGE